MAAVKPITAKPSLDAERFLPADMLGIIALEHWHRYLFAARYTSRKIVLDLACGDGYGSDYLAANASHVYGIDISGPTIALAKDKYNRANLQFLVGSCTDIPLADKTVDVVVSFETIEHHDQHSKMMMEFKRVLKPVGMLIISTPDKSQYSEMLGIRNPHHVKELLREEFQSLLAEQFGHVRLLGQRVMFGSVIVPPLGKSPVNRYVMSSGDVPQDAGLEPVYWIALASDKKLPKVEAGFLDDLGLLLEASRNRGRNKLLTGFIRNIAAPSSGVLRQALREEWYKANNADVVSEGMDPEMHWHNYGHAEGRLPAKDLRALVENLVAERVQLQHARLCDALSASENQQNKLIESLREREVHFDARLEEWRKGAQRERELDRESAQLQLAARAEEFERREAEFTQELINLKAEVLSAHKDADESSKTLRNEIVSLRLRARYEVEALLRSEAAKESELRESYGKEIEALRADKERALEAERESWKERLDVLTEELKTAQINWQSQSDEARGVQRQLGRQLEALRVDKERALEAVRESWKERLDVLTEELKSREISWQSRFDEASGFQEQLNEQLDYARQHIREQESTYLQQTRERDREFGRQLHALRAAAERAREVDRKWAQQQLQIETSKAHRREQESFAQFGSQLESVRGEAERARELDRQAMQDKLQTHVAQHLEKEAELRAVTERLRRRVIEIESSWMWRLRSLFVSDQSASASFYAGEEKVNRSNGKSPTQVASGADQVAHQLPQSLSELLRYEDLEFVQMAYLAVLGRKADPAGLWHYLKSLRDGIGKLQIIWILHTSAEGRVHPARLEGLRPAMSHYRWRRLPIVAYFARQREAKRNLLYQARLARSELSDLQGRHLTSEAALREFLDFDPQSYLSINKDVARAKTNPFEHYIRFGHREHRKTRGPIVPSPAYLTCDWLLKSRWIPAVAEGPVVDIIIPVFNGYELLEPLFESLVSHTRSPFRLIIVDDCSSDARVAPVLSDYATKIPGTLLLTNSTNLGFIGSVNRALEQVSTELLVLLNSDTEVPPRWLDRLILPLQRDDSIASVTPFSNAATICSFPIALMDNPLYLGRSADEIDRAFEGIGTEAQPIEIPTGVGFCMAMRKSVVDQIGTFDPIYGRGYGEENDWCMRARACGYRHVQAVNLFVFHKHGGSFQSEEKARLIEGNLRTLNARYPGYRELIETHIQADPGKGIREYVKLRLFAEATEGVTVVIDHGLGGGANAFRSTFVKSLLDEGRVAVVLIDSAQNDEQFQMIIHGGEGETRFSLPNSEMLIEFLQSLQVAVVVYNNLVGSGDPLALIRRLVTLVRAKSWPLQIMMHDFYPICPSYTLIDQTGEYCGVPDSLEICEKCMRGISNKLLPYRPSNLDMRDWRAAWQEFMHLATEIRCFSESSREILARAYPELVDRCSVVPHAVQFKPRKVPEVRGDLWLHIGVVGGINYSKGRGVIEALTRYIEDNRLGHRLSVIGQTDIPVPGVNVTGRYEVDELPDIIESLGINAILIPSIWPETFSYVTSEVIALGLPVACFNIGAPAERVRNYARGIVLDARDPASIFMGLSDIVSRPSLGSAVTLVS